MVPLSGPTFFNPDALCTNFRQHLAQFQTPCEATAVWRWSNTLHALIPQPRQCLRVGMDETSVKLYPQDRGGHLVPEAKTRRSSQPSLPMYHKARAKHAAHLCAAFATILQSNEIFHKC